MQENNELLKYPIFSLIIPIYNVSQYVRECIDSILNQSFQDFEIILVNDGSTDDSGEICQFYSENHENIKLFSQINKGTASARNVGIQNSKGKFIWFVDSDDLIKDNSLEFLIEIIKEHQEYDIISFNKLDFSKDETPIVFNQSKIQYNFFNNIEDYLLHFQNFPSSACLNIFKLDYIKNNNLYFQENIYFEDEMFNLKVYLYFSPKILVTNHQLYLYRRGIITSKTSLKENVVILKKIISKIELVKEIEKIKPNTSNALILKNKIKYYKEHILYFVEIYYLIKENSLDKFLKNEIKTYIKNVPLGKKKFKKSTLKKIAFNLNFDLFLFLIRLNRKLKNINYSFS